MIRFYEESNSNLLAAVWSIFLRRRCLQFLLSIHPVATSLEVIRSDDNSTPTAPWRSSTKEAHNCVPIRCILPRVKVNVLTQICPQPTRQHRHPLIFQSIRSAQQYKKRQRLLAASSSSAAAAVVGINPNVSHGWVSLHLPARRLKAAQHRTAHKGITVS